MIYTKFKHILVSTMMNGAIVKAALMNASYNDLPTHEFWSEISANEVAATGYLTGGQALTGGTFINGIYDANNPLWNIIGELTAQYVVFYIDTGTPSTSRLIANQRFPVLRKVINGVFEVQLPESGIFSLK